MVKIAIDPGGTNAGVAIQYQDGTVDAMRFSKYTLGEIAEEVRSAVYCMDDWELCGQAIIEKVHAFKGQGISSTFKFGKGTGRLIGMLETLHIPFKEVSPKAWMKELPINLPSGKDSKRARKNTIKEYSQRLNPKLKVTLEEADALAMLSVFDKVW